MDPHVGAVGGGNGVAEPLVTALVDDDEVEAWRDADAGPVAGEIAVAEAVAVGHSGLVFHAGVGNLDELVAVAREGVLAEVVLEGVEHALGLRELGPGFVEVFGQSVEIQSERRERGVFVVSEKWV